MQPTALHWTSTLGLFIWRMRGVSPPRETIKVLFWPASLSALLHIQSMSYWWVVPSTARLPNAAEAARCTSMSGLSRRYRIGSRVALSTGLTSVVHCVSCILLACARSLKHASFCDFGKGQAGASLQIDVLAVDEGGECGERFAGEEVGLASLCGSLVSRRIQDEAPSNVLQQGKTGFEALGVQYILEVVEEVGDGFPFRVCQDIIVVDLGAACNKNDVRLASETCTVCIAAGSAARRGVLPQQEKILRHRSAMLMWMLLACAAAAGLERLWWVVCWQLSSAAARHVNVSRWCMMLAIGPGAASRASRCADEILEYGRGCSSEGPSTCCAVAINTPRVKSSRQSLCCLLSFQVHR